tara:strand:- start:109 stop:825 length:717 start_codon:yes stop_codon:yes gene_type:complete
MKKNKIIFTGGSGRFGTVLKKIKTKNRVFFPTKKQLDITSYKKAEIYIKRIKPKYLIHAAALSRPMIIHDKNISKSIDINIIGTCNIVKICSKYKIKLIFFSTNYVYPSKSGVYKENDPLLPINTYAWSKMGGESAVSMYKNSLILRICMTEKPFVHKKVFSNMKTNFMFQEELAKELYKLINYKGVINIGGKIQSVYNFAKKNNPNVKKILANKSQQKKFPLNSTMNILKFKKIIKK